MRRPAVIVAVLLAVVVLGVAAAGLHRDPLAFTLGVVPGAAVATLQPGDELCQQPIAVPPGAGFDRVRFVLGTFGRPGPRVNVTVRDARTDTVLGRGRLPAGYADIGRQPSHDVRVGSVPAERTVSVCLADRGDVKVALYGNADVAAAGTTATRQGKAQGYDLTLIFLRKPRPVLAEAGAIARRAALFKPGWMGAWTVWLLAALVVLAVPALLVRAVAGAVARD
jgi:hypothetical protein